MDIQGALEQAISGVNGNSVGQAMTDHVTSMDGAEVSQHVQAAANNAAANGQPDIARELGDIVSRAESDPNALKAAAVDYVKSNPQALAQFAPSFVQNILSKV